MTTTRIRWAAIGAVLAICLGAGGVGVANAVKGTGERSVTTAIASCRLLDTRPTESVGGRTAPLGPGGTHTVKASGSNGRCSGIPGDITGVTINVTAIGATAPTHLTIWPSGAVPNSSSLNPSPGQPPTPNAVTTKVHTDGTFRIFNFQGNVHVIVDLVAYQQDHHHDDRYYTRPQIDSLTRVRDVSQIVDLPLADVEIYEVSCPSGEVPVSGGHVLTSSDLYVDEVQLVASFRGGWSGTYQSRVWAFAVVNYTVKPGTFGLSIQCVPSTSANNPLVQSDVAPDGWTPPPVPQIRP